MSQISKKDTILDILEFAEKAYCVDGTTHYFLGEIFNEEAPDELSYDGCEWGLFGTKRHSTFYIENASSLRILDLLNELSDDIIVVELDEYLEERIREYGREDNVVVEVTKLRKENPEADSLIIDCSGGFDVIDNESKEYEFDNVLYSIKYVIYVDIDTTELKDELEEIERLEEEELD